MTIQLSQAELKQFNKIKKHFSAISELFEINKNRLNADVNYFDNSSKIINNLLAVLTVKTETSFNTHTLYKQPVGIAFDKLYTSFTKYNTQITQVSIPSIKKLVSKTIQMRVTFDKSVEKYLDEIKLIYGQYNEIKTAERKKKAAQSLEDVISSTFVRGAMLHSQQKSIIESMQRIHNNILSSLETMDNFILSITEEEEKIIKETSSYIKSGFPFDPNYKELSREFQDKDRVSYFSKLISDTFLELISSEGPPVISKNESAAQKWPTAEKFEPFYARVWETYQAVRPSEVDVSKKELVKVIEAGLIPQWKVEKTNGETGYVPSLILEPVA